jgi:hypothetical protein
VTPYSRSVQTLRIFYGVLFDDSIHPYEQRFATQARQQRLINQNFCYSVLKEEIDKILCKKRKPTDSIYQYQTNYNCQLFVAVEHTVETERHQLMTAHADVTASHVLTQMFLTVSTKPEPLLLLECYATAQII